jgi:hypothetical protein
MYLRQTPGHLNWNIIPPLPLSLSRFSPPNLGNTKVKRFFEKLE